MPVIARVSSQSKRASGALTCRDPAFPHPSSKATKSAFSEQAHAYQPVATIKDVFEAVAAGDAAYGVVPFENSTHGVVTFTLGFLADREGAYRDLSVCGEVYIDVHHCLLGYKDPQPAGAGGDGDAKQQSQSQSQSQAATATATAAPAAPEHPLGHVQKVYSHPQAFGQTQAFLGAHLRGAEAVDVSSTSRAAELASLDRTGATAAVAGEIAAGAFGLDVLARNIEDRDDNTTRFFVLRRGRRRDGEEHEREREGTKDEQEEEGEEEEKERRRGYKSLVSFTVPHKAPGALASVLDVFRTYGLSLTSINSLPSLVQPFHYLFFVEFEGSSDHDPEGRVKRALEEVDRVAEGWRWLGSWERQR